MELFTATQSTWFLIGPIAKLLGYVMNWIYEFITWVGIPNIGLAIILFTIVIKALLIPLSIKQQKTSKLQSIMQPELQAVQAKYKGKTDSTSMMAQQEETKAIYAKYGTSMTGGCLQLLIQMPILFALYQVILKMPGYINKLYQMFESVVLKLQNIAGYEANEALISLAKANSLTNASAEILADKANLIDMMYNFSPAEWNDFLAIFNDGSLTQAYNAVAPQIQQATFFLGIDLTRTPWELLTTGTWWAVLIPILAGLFQWLSTQLASQGQPKKKPNDNSNPLGNSMQMMNVLFPIMSVVFCFMFNGGIGIYWVASSLVQLIIQLLVNAYLKKADLNAMVQKNVDKMNKRRIRRGQKPIKMQDVTVAVQNIENEKKIEEARKQASANASAESTEYYSSHTTAKKGSLAEKAGMVLQYEERQKALKSGKKESSEKAPAPDTTTETNK